MNTLHKRVLTILSGCPDGATTYNLTARLEIPPHILDALARSRLITLRDASVRGNGRGKLIPVIRAHITDAGKLALITMKVGRAK